MRSMNAALWQVGWGYYLSNMVGFDGTGLTTPILAWARDHFVNHVRSGGPYPALRCGRQPYGVLPVTSLDAWKPPAGQEQAFASDSWLRDLLHEAAQQHLAAAHSATRSVSAAARLPRPMPISPTSCAWTRLASGYSARSHAGAPLPAAPARLPGRGPAGAPASSRRTMRWRRACCSVWASRGVRVFPARSAAESAWAVTAPLVQDGEVSPWRGLEPNYIQTLLDQRSIAALTQARPDPASPTADAPACCSSCCATRCCASWPTPRAFVARRRRPRRRSCATPSSSISSPINRSRRRRRRGRGVSISRRPASPATRPCGNTSKGLNTFDTPATAALGDFRRSLTWLKDRDSETLQYLMQGTLDLSSHRLDAWITSFATKRLATMTAGGPQGALCGSLWMGREAQAHAGLVRDGRDDAAGRRGGPARHAQQRPGLHPRAVHDPCGRRRAAAQRASRPQRHADVRQPVRHRSVVAPRARSAAAARRPAPGPAARRAARLPPRARAA